MQQTAVKVDIPALLPSWRRSLLAARRSPRAVQSYTEAATEGLEALRERGIKNAAPMSLSLSVDPGLQVESVLNRAT